MTTTHYGYSRQVFMEWCSAALGAVVKLPAYCSFLVGLAVLLWQIMDFLANNHWTTITVLDGLRWWFGNQRYMGPYVWFTGRTPLALWLMVVQPLIWIVAWIVILQSLRQGYRAAQSATAPGSPRATRPS